MINVDLIYPIGSIYLSLNDANPNKLFGGTWERIKGKTLVGVDESDTDFKTSKLIGGEKTHKLTINEMPAHNHGINGYWGTTGGGQISVGELNTGNLVTNNTNMSGGGQAHNNLQPYYTCFIWYRTA